MSEPRQEVEADADVPKVEADTEAQQEEEMTENDTQNKIEDTVAATSGGDDTADEASDSQQQNPEDTNTTTSLNTENGADETEDTNKPTSLNTMDSADKTEDTTTSVDPSDSVDEPESQQTQEIIPDLGIVHAPIQEIHDMEMRVDIPATRFLIDDLNKDAAKLADSINHLSGGLAVNLHALSHICTQYISVHEAAVTEVGVAVDRSLAAMSSLMIGCEQISENMPPVEQLMEQLTKVKETLDILEATVGPEFP